LTGIQGIITGLPWLPLQRYPFLVFGLWQMVKTSLLELSPEYEKKHTEDLPVFTVLVHGPVLLVWYGMQDESHDKYIIKIVFIKKRGKRKSCRILSIYTMFSAIFIRFLYLKFLMP
jgi:hypothetical protein